MEAHRFVLASCSGLFAELLGGGAHPHPLVYLRGVRHRHLAALLDFMYRGEVTVEQEALPAFLKTAEELRVKGLIEKLEEEEVPPHPITPCTSGRALDVVKSPNRSKEEQTRTVKKAKRKLTPKRRSIISSESGDLKRARKDPACAGAGRQGGGGEGVGLADTTGLQRANKESRGKAEEVEEQGQEQGKGLVEVTEDRKEVEVVEEQEDATDETISEVERMLRETKAILGMEKGQGPGGGLDSNAKARTKDKDISGRKGDVAEWMSGGRGGGLAPSTPAKAFSTSEKQLQVTFVPAHLHTCTPAHLHTCTPHFGANCVGSKMQLPYYPSLCSRMIIDNLRRIEGALFGSTAPAKVFLIYALS